MSEVNVGHLCYGNPVVGMIGRNSVEHWIATTLYPEHHDQAIMFLREMRSRSEAAGFHWETMDVEVRDGKTSITHKPLDDTPIETIIDCYHVKFFPKMMGKLGMIQPLFGFCVGYKEGDPEKRSAGFIPFTDYRNPELVIIDL